MLKIVAVAILGLFVCAQSIAFAQEKQTEPAKEKQEQKNIRKALIFATRQKGDFITNVPPNRITIHHSSTYYKNEHISVLPILVNVAGDDCKYNVEYSFKLVSPKGDEQYIAKAKKISGKLNDKNEILFLPENLRILYENSDEFGKYNFVLSGKNLNTNENFEETLTITLAEFPKGSAVAYPEKRDFDEAFKNYHKEQKPETLRNLFASEHSPVFKENGSLNHATLVFFREAFREKPFLFDILEAEFDTATDNVRMKTILLFASLGENKRLEKKIMTQKEKTVFENAFRLLISIKSPYEEESGLGAQDMLWGEFFAKGNYRPIEKMFSYLQDYKSAKAFVERLKRGEKIDTKDEQQRKDAVKNARFLAAAFSLSSNLKVPLVANFADFYLIKNKKTFTIQNLKDAFTLLREYVQFKNAQKQKTQDNTK